MHCKHDGRTFVANMCRGIAECHCDCAQCLEADNLASEVDAETGYDEIECPAKTDSFESESDDINGLRD